MGVWKRPSGKWSYEFQFKGKRFGSYDFRTKAEAAAAEAQEKERLKKSTTDIIFLQAINSRMDYLEAYTTPNHYRDNKAIIKKFSEWVELLISEITPEMVRNKLIDLSKEIGNHNANRHLIGIKAVFSQAVKDGFLARNPCLGIPKFPVTKAVKYIPPREHISKVLLLAKPMDRAYLIVIWLTGARVREINNLTWEDVNFDNQTIRLWTRKKKGGHKSPRLIPMVKDVISSLKYVWEHRDKLSSYVFTNPDTRTKYDYRDKFLHTLCRRAGLPNINYHELRHHTASALASKGVDLPTIQKILGHERATTTDNYLQNLGNSIRSGMAVLEGFSDGVTTESTTEDISKKKGA